jgi:putative transposase
MRSTSAEAVFIAGMTPMSGLDSMVLNVKAGHPGAIGIESRTLKATGLSEARVRHKPRLLSDNGPCYISGELKAWLKNQDMEHTRGAPYHPQTQGKIERYHRSMKNVVKLENYYYPRELEKAITEWVTHYNHERYHESLDNVTPADVYEGRRNEILDQRALVKMRTLNKRKVHNLLLAG